MPDWWDLNSERIFVTGKLNFVSQLQNKKVI